MEIIQNAWTVFLALRWVWAAVAFALLAVFYAEEIRERRRLERRVEKMRRSNEILVTQNRALSAARRRPKVIVGRVVNQ